MFFSPAIIEFRAKVKIVESRLIFTNTTVPVRFFTSVEKDIANLKVIRTSLSDEGESASARFWSVKDTGDNGTFRALELTFLGETLNQALQNDPCQETVALYDAFIATGQLALFVFYRGRDDQGELVDMEAGLILRLDYASH